jgi:uncharacterized membrane protein YqgA involved in biofilm formation
VSGTILNVAAVLVGATIGSLLGDRLPERLRDVAMQALGLVVLLIGAQMALQAQNVLIVLASAVLGGMLGEAAGIEARLEHLGAWLERRFGGSDPLPTAGGSRFVRAFVSSSLVFCVGPLTILGAIQDGLSGDVRLLAVKSLLDLITSIAFASALGRGVYASTLVILVYQGGLSLAARALGASIPDPAHNPAVLETTAVGGLLILGIGLRLLEIKPIRVANLMPAVALAPLFTIVFGPPLARLLPTG